jgi:hypothetical protein
MATEEKKSSSPESEERTKKEKAREEKAREEKAREEKAREEKAGEEKAREEKAGEGEKAGEEEAQAEEAGEEEAQAEEAGEEEQEAGEAGEAGEVAAEGKAKKGKAKKGKAKKGKAKKGRAKEKVEASDSSEDEAGEEEQEDEGWPRSWIVVTAILGIIAIIVVARLMGQSWSSEELRPPPGPGGGERPEPGKPGPPEPGKPGPPEPGNPEARPAAGPAAAILKVASVEIVPGGRSCVTAGGKGVKLDKAEIPAACRIAVKVKEANSFRLEVTRKTSMHEVGVLVQPAAPGVPFLVQAFLPPQPRDERPTWIAGSMAPHTHLAVIIENPSKKKKVVLSTVRLFASRRD